MLVTRRWSLDGAYNSSIRVMTPRPQRAVRMSSCCHSVGLEMARIWLPIMAIIRLTAMISSPGLTGVCTREEEVLACLRRKGIGGDGNWKGGGLMGLVMDGGG